MAHPYQPHCGCHACCLAEEAEERRIEAFGTPSRRRWQKPFGCFPYRAATDLLVVMGDYRTTRANSAAIPTYREIRTRAMRPTLKTLAVAETGIKQRNALVPSNLHPVFEHLFAPFRRAA